MAISNCWCNFSHFVVMILFSFWRTVASEARSPPDNHPVNLKTVQELHSQAENTSDTAQRYIATRSNPCSLRKKHAARRLQDSATWPASHGPHGMTARGKGSDRSTIGPQTQPPYYYPWSLLVSYAVITCLFAFIYISIYHRLPSVLSYLILGRRACSESSCRPFMIISNEFWSK